MPVISFDGSSEISLLCRLDLDHPIGVDLVDLSKAFVTLGLGRPQESSVIRLVAPQLLLAAGG